MASLNSLLWWSNTPLRLFVNCWPCVGDLVPDTPKIPSSSGAPQSLPLRPRRSSERPCAGVYLAAAQVLLGTDSVPALLPGLPTAELTAPSLLLRFAPDAISLESPRSSSTTGATSRLTSSNVPFGGNLCATPREGGLGPQLSIGIGCRIFLCSNASVIFTGLEQAPNPAAAEAEGTFFLLIGLFSSPKEGTSSNPRPDVLGTVVSSSAT
mmetsp:Transcript_55333/g.86071  ORF Transcript_55333/g.86071 Transcript_55333/m.86071 type:complete len:210 (-) Transcript_55333:474-1103(-)